MRAARAVAATFVAAVGVVAIVALFDWGPLAAGTNDVKPTARSVGIGPGQSLCQLVTVPPNAGAVELLVQTSGLPGPALTADVRAGARRLGGGSARGGYGDGWTRIPLSRGARLERPQPNATLCVKNVGSSRVAVVGAVAAGPGAASVGATSTGLAAPIRWREAPASWPAKAATVMRRTTRGKADLGPWAPLLLLAAVWAGALALVLTRRPT